jgi:hypothetical protein
LIWVNIFRCVSAKAICRRQGPGATSRFASDLPDGQITRVFDFLVQPLLQKYSDFPKTQISLYPLPSRSTEGRLAIVTDAGRDAVDADGAKDEST